MPHATTTTAILFASVAAASATADDARNLAARLRADAAMKHATAVQNANPASLDVSVLMQTRYLASTRGDPQAPNSEAQTYGFDIPRAQIRLSGNLINRQITGYLNFDFGDAEGDRGRGRAPSVAAGNGSPQLREAYVQYNFSGENEGFYAKVGQFKSAILTEDAIAPEYQIAVERSVSNEFFSLGLTQGVAVGRVTDQFAWEVSFNDGGRYWGNPEPANTAFNSTLEADWAASWRLDWKFAGDWARFADFTSWRGSDEGLRVGGGVHFQSQGGTNPDQIVSDFFQGTAQEVNVLSWALDVQYEGDGWALFAGYHGHRIEWEFGPNRLVVGQHGLVVQGSVFLDDHFEIFGRWDLVQIDGAITRGFGTSEETYHFYTVGVNWYMIPESHATKFTADVVFTRSNSDTFDIGAGGANSIFYPDASVTGLLGGADQELLVRGQFQVLF
ncbi:MAG: hypothetical protein AB8F26_06795 [Phycisphaerales bacterium]